jgi:hypothetical protein
MNDIRVITVSFLTMFILLAFSVFIIAGSRKDDQICLRVIVRLPVPVDWHDRIHTQPVESGVCKMAEDLDKERDHAH